jgi:release factor glutamine methyltransferase
MALFSGEDGLDDYKIIFSELPYFLKEEGYFLGEIGFDQKSLMQEIIQNYPQLKILDIKKDFNQNDRVVVVKKN